MKKLAGIFVAFLCAAIVSHGLETNAGTLKLVVDETTGRFAVYYAGTKTPVSVLYGDDMRTTFVTLHFDSSLYRLGDAAEFSVHASTTASGAVVEYRSTFCIVRQTITLNDSGSSFGVHYSIQNISEKAVPAGLRVLLDTWLGEKNGTQLSIQSAGVLAAERLFTPVYPFDRIQSAGYGIVLRIASSAPATVPDKIIAANWKRINDAGWLFNVNTTRNFSMLPYSIDDSAVALYYEPSKVAKGGNRSIQLQCELALENEGAASVEETKPDIPLVIESDDIAAVKAILKRINEALQTGNTLSADERSALDEELRRIRERAAAQ